MSEPLTPLSESQMEVLESAVSSYQGSMTESGARYLHARGIEEETARQFRLGIVTDPQPGHGKYAGMLCIPYLDKDGMPLTMRFRCMKDHDHRAHYHGKYNSMLDDPVRVFNIGAIHTAGNEIHIAEGELDCMILTQIGLSAVAIPGASAWQYHHKRMLAGFSRVYIWGDPDDAGAKFTNKVMSSMHTAKGVHLKTGDVSDTYLSGGAEALYALLNRKDKR